MALTACLAVGGFFRRGERDMGALGLAAPDFPAAKDSR